MTDQEINIAIAEFCGNVYIPPVIKVNPAAHRLVWENALPNYSTDLNAMHEAESKLSEQERLFYMRKLLPKDCNYNLTNGEVWGMVNATARQRAEALLRTIGKWRDS